ncbi:MAG: Rpn family recombination-promoting nuclease/putative transposase [Oscillospiraceae bacterium]|jgi:predicted transposase/invertase (TIGR01784 family)|nr:Rpn family recombination-promoting nuclease/putative transposase [Oscillospiraceae bacterium]
MSVLRLPQNEFDSLAIIDPNLPREFEDDKLGILDVKLKLKSGKIIDIEIQVKSLPHLRERVIFYTSKMVTEQIRSGNDYGIIKPVVTIIIADFTLFDTDSAYHHRFELYDKEHSVLFSDLMGVHILELPKLPETDDNTDLWEWLKFIKSDDMEELEMLAQRSPTLSKAVGIRMELSQDERLRMIAEAKEKARRDEADWLWGIEQEKNRAIEQEKTRAKEEERAELFALLSQLGVSSDILSKATALRDIGSNNT